MSARSSCVVQSARVMDDTIWVSITDTDPVIDPYVGSRILSVSRSSRRSHRHLSLEGRQQYVRGPGSGRRALRPLHGHQPAERQLVAIERGETRVLETSVSGFRLSDDGRFLAVSFSNPQPSEPSRFEITDLVDRTITDFRVAVHQRRSRSLVARRPLPDRERAMGGPDGLDCRPVVRLRRTDPRHRRFLDGACFMNDRMVAHRTWNVGYGQGDAQPGVIRLTSLDTGSTVAEIGDDLFGDSFRCHPDGSISYLRRPVVNVELSPDFSQLEPDYEAPVELIHIARDGTTSVTASGDLRMV